MYRRFEAELTFAGMTKKELAEKVEMKYDTLVLKLAGKSPLNFADAIKLKEAINTNVSLEELFKCE